MSKYNVVISYEDFIVTVEANSTEEALTRAVDMTMDFTPDIDSTEVWERD